MRTAEPVAPAVGGSAGSARCAPAGVAAPSGSGLPGRIAVSYPLSLTALGQFSYFVPRMAKAKLPFRSNPIALFLIMFPSHRMANKSGVSALTFIQEWLKVAMAALPARRWFLFEQAPRSMGLLRISVP